MAVYCFASPGTGGDATNTYATGGNTGSGGALARGPSPASGGAAATGGVPATGGAQATVGASPAICSDDPTTDQGPACNDCTFNVDPTKMNCVPARDGCSLELLGSDAKRQKCLKLYCCFRVSRCTLSGDTVKCWCGTASLMDCQTSIGAANGPCLHEIEDAAESTSPALIKQRLVDPEFAVSGAVNLISCRGSFCAAECDVP